MTDWDEIARFAQTLPLTTLGTSYGTPALKVRGTLLARLREDGAMVLKVEDGLRDTLLETQPEAFYTTDHYAGYPTLLVRLDVVEPAQLETLVERAWGGMVPMKVRNAHSAAERLPHP